MKRRGWVLAVLAALIGVSAQSEPAGGVAPAGELKEPDALKAGGAGINVDGGKPVLLVGQFGSGKLRAYPVEGTADGLKLGKHSWVRAGGKDASVPSG
ncbi:MAG TPA: hypothetical protein PKD86_05600 [Gemmatales bacterium]|nr:hypothetical protein [Gemmatales bacterium]